MRELIASCGGTVAGSVRGASICIGNPGRLVSIPAVREAWILGENAGFRLVCSTTSVLNCFPIYGVSSRSDWIRFSDCICENELKPTQSYLIQAT